MKFKGTLVHQDLGAGVWVLETEDGEHLQLDGPVPEGLEGKEVVVEGRKRSSFGFGMIGGGKSIEVGKIEAA